MAGKKIRIMTAAMMACALFSTGCDSLFHNMQPHRLWRMNRGKPLGRDPYFSVQDQIPSSANANTNNHSPGISLGAEDTSFGSEGISLGEEDASFGSEEISLGEEEGGFDAQEVSFGTESEFE